jgi:aminomuconate-semialdehyde/2-hydroxymuconate-6-semialdehyde dehydrogenase
LDKIKNYIDGQLIEPVSGKYIDNFNPSLGEVYSLIPDSDERDIELAAQSAEKAFPSWSVTPVEERSKILFRLAGLIEKNLDKFALAESIDNGMPVSLAKRVDIPRAVKNFEFCASAIIGFTSEAHITEDKAINYTFTFAYWNSRRNLSVESSSVSFYMESSSSACSGQLCGC